MSSILARNLSSKSHQHQRIPKRKGENRRPNVRPSLVSQIFVLLLISLLIPTLLETYEKTQRTTKVLVVGLPPEALTNEEGRELSTPAKIEDVRPSATKTAAGIFAFKIGTWLIVAFSFYINASLAGSPAGFLGIMTGLALVRVMAVLLLMVLAAFAAVVTLLTPSIAPALLGSTALAYVVLVFIFQLYFLMGVFDVGCFGAVDLNFLATRIAFVIQIWLAETDLKPLA